MSDGFDEPLDVALINELVEQYRRGDERAAEKLYAMFSMQMLNLARRIVLNRAHKSSIDVEGAVNSGFRSFFSVLGKPVFDSRKGQIGGLLATIVSRKVYVQLRKKQAFEISLDDRSAVTDCFVQLAENEDKKSHILELKNLLEPILTAL
jgi:hypothetical protein